MERADGLRRQSAPASGIMHDARSLAHLDREAVRERVRLVRLVQQLESWRQSHNVQPTQMSFAFRAIAPHAYVCAPSSSRRRGPCQLHSRVPFPPPPFRSFGFVCLLAGSFVCSPARSGGLVLACRTRPLRPDRMVLGRERAACADENFECGVAKPVPAAVARM